MMKLSGRVVHCILWVVLLMSLVGLPFFAHAAVINDGVLRLLPTNFDNVYRKLSVLINASEVNKTTGTSFNGVLIDSIIDSLNTSIFNLNATQFHIRTNQKLTFDDANVTGILYNGTTNRLQADIPFQFGNGTTSLYISSVGFQKKLGSSYQFGAQDTANFTQILLGHANTTQGFFDVAGTGTGGELYIQTLSAQGATKFGAVGIFPETDNTSTIGNTTQRWNGMYIHTINMTGDLSIHGKINTFSPLIIQTDELSRILINSTDVLFTSDPEINNSLSNEGFAVSCDVRNTGLLGTAIPDVCYNWISFPLDYETVPTTVTLSTGAATGGASGLAVSNKKMTGFLVSWNCDNTVGQCGYLSANYSVTP